MNDYHYIPEITSDTKVYTFRVTIMPNSNGHWQAWIASLPGCRVWGYTKEEALYSMTRAAEECVHALVKNNLHVPSDESGVPTDMESIITVSVPFSSFVS